MLRRYKHDLSHFRHTTFDMGQLTPIGRVYTLQGDTIKHRSNLLLRTSPLVYPIMHPVHTYVSHYAVPLRLLWDKWTDFITGGEDFDDASVVPTITFDGAGANPDPVVAGSLANHLGLPVGFSGTVNAFLFRAYAFIYNERVRDDQLQAKVGFTDASGPDTTTNTELLNANWGSDMFTKARPDDQLGDEVTLSLTGDAPVRGLGWDGNFTTNTSHSNVRESGNTTTTTYPTAADFSDAATREGLIVKTVASGATAYPDIYADLSDVDAINVNQLRLAIATQQWQEYINISGNTYKDYLNRYGIKYSDARLDLPEFLGASKKLVQFSEVLATAEGTNTDVGDMAGHGIAALRSNSYMKFFEEPCIILSLGCVKPIPMYMEGVDRFFTINTKEEWYQKEFEILGWQEVLNQEIQFNHTTPGATFGYTPRHEEYRGIPNTVHGEFATTLKNWHMARFFDADGSGGDVALNSSFITCNPTERVFADTNENHIKLSVQHKIAARRIVPLKPRPSGFTL